MLYGVNANKPNYFYIITKGGVHTNCRQRERERELPHEMKQLYNSILQCFLFCFVFWTKCSEVDGRGWKIPRRFEINIVSQGGDAGFREPWDICYAVRVDYTHNHINSTEHLKCEMDLATAQQF